MADRETYEPLRQISIDELCAMSNGAFIGCMSRKLWIHIGIGVVFLCFLIGAIFAGGGLGTFFGVMTAVIAIVELIFLYSRFVGHGKAS